MATSFSPYVTVYDKRTKMGHLVYRASLQSFLNSGNYTQEKPAGAKVSDTLMQSQLPTAGREANRVQQLKHLQTPGLETEPISGVVRPEIANELKETNAQRHLREIEEPITEEQAEPDPTPTVEATTNEDKPSRGQPRRRAKAKTDSES